VLQRSNDLLKARPTALQNGRQVSPHGPAYPERLGNRLAPKLRRAGTQQVEFYAKSLANDSLRTLAFMPATEVKE